MYQIVATSSSVGGESYVTAPPLDPFDTAVDNGSGPTFSQGFVFGSTFTLNGIDLLAAPGHKALLGPLGTGFLYVRRENIEGLWGLQPTAASRAKDIRKFEEIGTHPAANHNAIAEALTFHEGIGSERKAEERGTRRSRACDVEAKARSLRSPHEFDCLLKLFVGTDDCGGVLENR